MTLIINTSNVEKTEKGFLDRLDEAVFLADGTHQVEEVYRYTDEEGVERSLCGCKYNPMAWHEAMLEEIEFTEFL